MEKKREISRDSIYSFINSSEGEILEIFPDQPKVQMENQKEQIEKKFPFEIVSLEHCFSFKQWRIKLTIKNETKSDLESSIFVSSSYLDLQCESKCDKQIFQTDSFCSFYLFCSLSSEENIPLHPIFSFYINFCVSSKNDSSSIRKKNTTLLLCSLYVPNFSEKYLFSNNIDPKFSSLFPRKIISLLFSFSFSFYYLETSEEELVVSFKENCNNLEIKEKHQKISSLEEIVSYILTNKMYFVLKESNKKEETTCNTFILSENSSQNSNYFSYKIQVLIFSKFTKIVFSSISNFYLKFIISKFCSFLPSSIQVDLFPLPHSLVEKLRSLLDSIQTQLSFVSKKHCKFNKIFNSFNEKIHLQKFYKYRNDLLHLLSLSEKIVSSI